MKSLLFEETKEERMEIVGLIFSLLSICVCMFTLGMNFSIRLFLKSKETKRKAEWERNRRRLGR